MATNIFLGYPPENIKNWIIENYGPKEDPMLKVPLTFTAEEPNATFSLQSEDGPAITLETLMLSENDDWTTFSDDDWQTYNVGNEITLTNVGDKVMFRNSSDGIQAITSSYNKYHKFDISQGKIAASGNIMFLMDKTGELKDLSSNYYYNMFQGCSSLTKAPALPATTLAYGCYSSMFEDCTSLTQAPVLPAETLPSNCYDHMFYNCTSLTQAPALPATTLGDMCYSFMFYNCTSLTQAPVLPAETIIEACYECMFYGCTSLTNAYFPNLDSDTVINEVVEGQVTFYDAADNIETQCSDKTIIINSTSV